ncbi:Fc.00g094090.m01.CDS01 [Cosmosporella sp. VM-42]
MVTIPTLYSHIDAEEIRADAESYLLYYGMQPYDEAIVRASGNSIETASGHCMFDWTSGQMCSLLGHGHPEVVTVIQKHAESLDHLWSSMYSPPVTSLAKRLVTLAPPGLDKALFLNTGSESNEAAIRLAKFFTSRFEIVGLGGSWHGMTGVALGAQYADCRNGYGPVTPGNFALPAPNAYRSIFRRPDGSYDWETELDYGFGLIDTQSCGSLATAIVEPILSAGGILELPPGYLKRLKQHCTSRGMLLIVDEVQTGIGRTGDMFAFTHHPEDEAVVPDILTLSKTLGSGLPISAVLTSNKIAAFAKKNDFSYVTTHTNDPLTAAVGDKVVEIVVRDNLVEYSRTMGLRLQAGLRHLQSRYGCIGDVRGRGLMAGMEIVSDRETKAGAPELGSALAQRMAQLGVWTSFEKPSGIYGVFRFIPPLTTTEKGLYLVLGIMEEAFRTTSGTMPLY